MWIHGRPTIFDVIYVFCTQPWLSLLTLLCAIAFAKASSLCRRLLRKCGEQPIRCGLQKRRSPFIILSKGTLLVSLKESEPHEFSHFLASQVSPNWNCVKNWDATGCSNWGADGRGGRASCRESSRAQEVFLYFWCILSMYCMLQMSCSEKALVCSSLWRTIEPWSPRLRMPGQHCSSRWCNMNPVFQGDWGWRNEDLSSDITLARTEHFISAVIVFKHSVDECI